MENAKFNIFKNIYFFLKQMADFMYQHQNMLIQTNEHIMFYFVLVAKETSVEIHIIKLLMSYSQFSKCTIDNKDNKLFWRLFFMLNYVFFQRGHTTF